MTLTLSQPAKAEFEYKTHEYSPKFYSTKSAQFSPKINGGPVSSLHASASSAMGTPHRGLPPPSAIALPDPRRSPPHMSSSLVSSSSSMPSAPLGALPPAPSQWQGAEDSMRNWLSTKAEEERRRQEEEKRGQEEEKRKQEEARARQEELRLEQRRIEQSMLRESIQGGIPPHLVPIIFAGIGGGSLSNITAEWIQQYSSHLHAAQQQVQAPQQGSAPTQTAPGSSRDSRALNQPPPGPYGAAPQTPHAVLPPTAVLPGQPLPGQSQHGAFSTSTYAHMSPRARAAAQQAPPPQSELSRPPTGQHMHQPPAVQTNVQQLQHSQQPQQEQRSSSPIYFHHWVPPASSQEKPSGGNPPPTPSGYHYTSSPKKRKAQGGHAAPPPPTSAPQSHHSPSYSRPSSSTSTPRRGHARARSDASTRGHDGPGGAMSRFNTYSIHEQQEQSVQQARYPEQRYPEPPRESHHQYQQSPHQSQYSKQLPPPGPLASAFTPAFRAEEGREGPPAMAIQGETRQSSAQHHVADQGNRSVPASPRREMGGQ